MESFWWRLSLHAVYVSNLSNKVSKKAIWEIFNDFGVVVDAFLSNRKQNGSSCFAFVRYRFKEESVRAVELGNGRRVDGRQISVRKDTDRKIDRASQTWKNSHSGGGQVNTNYNPATRFNQRNARLQSGFFENRRRFLPNNRVRGQRVVRERSQVRRMFHRVRREDRRHGHSPGRKNGVLNNNPCSGCEDDVKDDSAPVEPPKNDAIQAGTSIPIDNALEEGELERSIIVMLNGDGILTEAIQVLSKMDLKVQIRELSSITLLLTFEEASLVDVCIGMVKSLDALCNDSGKLVKIDDITLRRESLKFARCQVLISSLSDIPKLVVGTSMDIKFKIHVTVEKDAEPVPVVSQEDNCTPAPLFCASQDDLSPSINELALVLAENIDSVFIDDIMHVQGGIRSGSINDDSRTKISVEEIMGESLNFFENEYVSREIVVFNADGVSSEENVDFVAETFEEQHVSDPGAHYSPSSSLNTSRASLEINNDGGIGFGKNFNPLGLRVKWVKCKGCEKKKRDKKRRRVNRLIYGDKTTIVIDSEASLSDGAIRRRNNSLKEADDTFEILSWNVRGLGRREKRRAVRSVVARNQADMVLLQESKLSEGDSNLIQSLRGKQNFQFRIAYAVGSAGGLISIWDESFFLLEFAVVEQRYILCVGVLRTIGFHCVIGYIYGRNEEQGRRVLWEELKDLKTHFDLPWILGGDFNVVLSTKDRMGAADNSQELIGSSLTLRARRNHIGRIEVDGRVVENPVEMKEVGEGNIEWLESSVSSEELYEAICACDGNKAPGPDGFNLCFIKSHWELLKDSMLEFISDFCNGKRFNANVNNSFITLIPKCDGASRLDQFRPINLVGCLYKILAKVLSRRLKTVLSGIVGETQFSFIQGRQILDCSLIANEAVEAMKKNKQGGICFEVDFEKAYDSVDWDFLDFIMRKMGFGDKWISWIMKLVTTPTISVLAVEIGLFTGFKVGNVAISHLQFADDTLIMCQADLEQVLNVRRVLGCFQLISGLKINFSKSSILGINVDQSIVQEWASIIKYKVGSFPCFYLGLPLGARPNSVALWKHVVERCQKKLASWKAKHLSMAGLGNGRKIYLVDWDSICKYKDQGGLGIVNLGLRSRALLNKWLWRFGNEHGSLWQKIVAENNGISSVGLFLNADFRRCSALWKAISKPIRCNDALSDFTTEGMLVSIGDDSEVDFLRDEWICGVILKDKFSRIFALASIKDGKAMDYGQFHNNEWKWNVTLMRELFGWELDQWQRFIDTISDYHLVEGLRMFCFGGIVSKEFIRLVLFAKLILIVGFLLMMCRNGCGMDRLHLRNEVVFNQKHFDALQLFDIIKLRLMWWAKAAWPNDVDNATDFFRFPNIVCISKRNMVVPRCVSWKCPAVGFMKFNVDEAARGKPGPAGIGGLMRDDTGKVWMEFSKSIGVTESNEAEICAIREAILMFCASRWVTTHGLIIESDSRNAIKWIECPDEVPWRLRKWVSHIGNLLKNCSSYSFNHIFREASMEADKLAKEGVDRSVPFIRHLV
ncbi:reverse transcriptase [Corchorus capsularis]|uniref:Reverse transcriptase n=1 Tax=Corchorus capsularis TaxID=210143 RepID=A0A1R3JVM8_COCAP|nr:reverse transcriptase [Corchorus capsularis]